ncbi:MAG: hypothetical protein ACO1QR_07435 [Chthoniobacteraceae bacterium]
MSLPRCFFTFVIAFCFLAQIGQVHAAETPGKATGFVTVQFPLVSEREHRVPWQRGLTVHRAIEQAAGSETAWKVAWRWRSTFWTRHSLNPHSLLARILSGEGATGYRRFTRGEAQQRKARVRPGDRILVDLAPIS